MFHTVLFDLDGTLTDPKEGITKSVVHGLAAIGIHVQDPDTLTAFIGPPLLGSLKKYYGLNETDCATVLRAYQERFESVGYKENSVYDGVFELLTMLRSRGVRLGVATAKPQPNAKMVLDYYGLSEYFDVVSGCPADETIMEKSLILANALHQFNVTEQEKAHIVMVGDRDNDVLAAKACGIPCIGLRFGYAEPGELEGAQADYLVDSVKELTKLLSESCTAFSGE